MFFGKISIYTGIQALKFRIQALFLMQIQNFNSEFTILRNFSLVDPYLLWDFVFFRLFKLSRFSISHPRGF